MTQVANKIDVLDKGFVRLVEHMGSDLSIVRAARVSYNADWRSGENEKNDEKLIRFLMKNHHTSPFESVVFTFEVKAPLFVFRQWHRHRTWSYNEISARYTELDEGFYIPAAENITHQAKDNKQARTSEQHPQAEQFAAAMRIQSNAAFKAYQEMLKAGCPRELARSVLPVSAYSRMFGTVDLHNLLHFLRLRLNPHAQYEIRVYAEAMQKLVSGIVPVTMAAFEESMLESSKPK